MQAKRMRCHLEDEINKYSPKGMCIIDSKQQDLRLYLQVYDSWIQEKPRWHHGKPIQHSNTGAVGDYTMAWCFPCCGEYILRYRASPKKIGGCV